MNRRITTARLLELGNGLSEQERQLVRTVASLRLGSHAQLAALLDLVEPTDRASASSAARSARRVLARLVAESVLARLERRVGGLRAGSSGYCYYLGPVGQRLVAYWNGEGLTRGRFRPEPGGRYVRHRLAVTGLYVELRTADSRGRLELLGFDGEPACWRRYLDGFGAQMQLKPDAFVRIGDGAYELRSFVEVDLGTESRTVVARKLQSYWDYFQTGQEQAVSGLFPRVVWVTNGEERRRQLVDICARMPAESWQLFAVTTLDRARDVLSGSTDSGDAVDTLKNVVD